MGKNNKKYTYEEVYNYFKEQGCELLEKEYINTHTKMKYICCCGSIDYKTFAHFRRGQRCKKCKSKKLSEQRKLDYEFVKNILKKITINLLVKNILMPMKKYI